METRVSPFRRYGFLLSELVKKGIRLKYRRSYLGILWSLIEPILTTIVLVIVFGTLYGNKDPLFPIYVICGRLIYASFSDSTKEAGKSIRKNAAMIKKVYVPKYLYPLSEVVFRFIIFAISLLSLVAVAVYCQKPPTEYIWQIIPSLIALFIINLGVSLVLATVNVFFRDIEYIWNVLCMLIMYMCAIFYYPEKILQSHFGFVLKLNPIYGIIDMFRGAMMGYMASTWTFIYVGCFALVSLGLGALIFKCNQDKFILHI